MLPLLGLPLAGALLASLVLSPAAVSAPGTEQPPSHGLRIYGGNPADGNPGVVALAIRDGGEWVGMCSAAMWKPRLLLTAAHCLTREGSSDPVDGVAVFPPGAAAVTYSDTGPESASPVVVTQWWRASDYANTDARVQPNDLAVIELSADLAAPAYTRLATHRELQEWAQQHVDVEHVGYGLVAPGQGTITPRAVTLPLTSFATSPTRGEVFSTQQTAEKGICPGDSGSPVFRMLDGQAYLIGTEAGSNSPCQDPPAPTLSNVGFAAMGYLGVLNPALASAGYATIPGPPAAIRPAARNRVVTIAWDAPTTSPETVSGYDVVSPEGVVVCQSATTSCALPDLPDGTYEFAVRSRNADGEGDALPLTGTNRATVAAPTRLPAPTIRRTPAGKARVAFTTLAGRSSAVVTSYVVRDAKGRVLCRVRPPDPEARKLACPGPTRPGRYRFTVVAQTEMGTTPPSPGSAALTVR